MLDPQATAIITVYNEAELITRAIESLQQQSAENIEILIVDDGSDDGTPDVVDGIADPRVRLVRLPRSGRAKALARACQEARGRYIANLDADDIAYPDRLKEQIAFLERHPDHAWVGCAEDRVDTQRNEVLSRRYPVLDQDVRRMAAKCIPYCHSGVTFRRSLLDEGINYDPWQPFLIDFEFFLRVAAKHKVANLEQPFVRRYARDESYFQSRFGRGKQNRRLAWFCLRAIRELGLPARDVVYPLSRTIYPWFPNSMKRQIRRWQGLSEDHG
ncbi:MAG: hypothetical protein Pars93KO_25220 [Parasphingorhabdus sp.]